MVRSFYSLMSFWLDHFMPIVRTIVDNLNKPWDTKTFHELIKQQQQAFLSSQTHLYRKLQN